jgi:hypothetical protein
MRPGGLKVRYLALIFLYRRSLKPLGTSYSTPSATSLTTFLVPSRTALQCAQDLKSASIRARSSGATSSIDVIRDFPPNFQATYLNHAH